MLRSEGVNFFLADGAAAGQDVFHVHLHVFARFAGDGFGLQLPPDHAIRPREELDAAASALRQAWAP
ncbi:MAG TPA: HIT domain-containing protein [Gaiellaceae bacterium]